ncbi:uncharacterized protein LOC126603009 [Malus sylvestris]|uniref:uncharacterized protein LOC126603009 n=1 Tax=Malus sylvestris TaxID=3752 RepID=UPI0021ABD7D6|nr:uncharacterized protein LOC126603009 [Malus sylvestris]
MTWGTNAKSFDTIWKWEDITMDFVYGLSRTPSRFDGIWLSKLFIDNIVRLHGVPIPIISNRDPRFTSRFWKAFNTAMAIIRGIGIAPYEALYGKACQTPLCLIKVGERVLMGLKIVDTTKANIQPIKRNLKLSHWKGVVRFGKPGKLSPRYIGPYQIIERIGLVAYRLELPPELSLIHNIFHVSILRKYVPDLSHIIQLELLEVNQDASYVEEPVAILDRQDKVLRNKVISLVKVLWRNHDVEEATWETEDLMRSQYSFLFG